MNNLLSKLKRNRNAGIAMISIIIAVAFISIIGSALLYITYLNYQMKVQNLRSKENFYETDGQIVQITTNLRDKVVNSSNPQAELENILGFDSTTFKPETGTRYAYKVEDMARLASGLDKNLEGNVELSTLGDGSIKGTITTGGKTDTFNYSAPVTYNESGVITSGGYEILKSYQLNSEGEMEEVSKPNPVTYRIHDFTIEQTSSDGYVNRVKTDIDIQILTKQISASGEGGVGSFSLLMDAPLAIEDSDFDILNLYGNCFFSKYENSTAVWTVDSNTYTPPGKVGSAGAALTLGKESKVNVVGQYLIVYGDLVLNNSACLYINQGNLTVYGDIYLNGNSTIICTGNIYQYTDEALPGRSNPSKVIIEGNSNPDANLWAKHIYPKTCNVVSVTEKNYQSFTNAIKLNNSNTSDDGVIYQLMKEYKGHKLTDDEVGKPVDQLEENSNYGSFYGQQVGIAFSGKNTAYNGVFKDRLVFLAGSDAQISEGNYGCTFICKTGLKLTNAHSVSLTKIGSSTFNFLMIKSSDLENPNYQNNVHQWKDGNFGSDLQDGFSFGDFFIDEPDKVVNDMLACGNGTDGGGSDSDDDSDDDSAEVKKLKYESALSFVNYRRDFEK